MRNPSLAALTALSREYGNDVAFVIGGGGNTSMKTRDTLFIKPSGVSLASITGADFLPMARTLLAAIANKHYSTDPHVRSDQVLVDLLAARRDARDTRRPSVEVLLHNLLPQRFVAHTHPPLVNGLTCAKNGRALAAKMFGRRVLWVPYIDPGYLLFIEVAGLVAVHQARFGSAPEALLLENHGLIVGGDTVEKIRSTTAYILETLAKRVRRKPDFGSTDVDSQRAADLAPAIRMLLWSAAPSSVVTFCANREISRLVENRSVFKPVSSFSPDHIVFCKHEPLFVPAHKDIDVQYRVLTNAIGAYRARNKCNPLIVCVEKLGMFAHGESCKTAEIAKLAFLDAVKVCAYTESFGGPKFMTPKQIDFITNWEMESFRKKIAAGALGSARFQGKIAIVTGAAQGFGKGIAGAMAAEGGCVVVADLNAPAAIETVGELCSRWGRGSAIATVTNVADETSVRAMVERTVLTYGGVDALVSNAGILRAGGLDDMDQATFDLVTKVNYTAFFLCVKHAARVMKIQHRFAPARYFDIIQINSKSGLQGSKANFAYAGGKFGSVGLVQSFALELVEHNIKVNAICPGNFFEGPLWSDPERGLFVQYLRAGKVPGARSVADVKKFYESKVPLRRGCSVEDVTRAILYAIEQQYETGQAIPVTGGQVMLN